MSTAVAIDSCHRHYDPIAKRFLMADSFLMENVEELVKRPREMNLYGYAANNPISRIDSIGNASYLASRDVGKLDSVSPASHNYIVIIEVPRQPEVVSFGPAKDGNLKNVSDNSTGVHATDVASLNSPDTKFQRIDAPDSKVREAANKVSEILKIANVDYKYPWEAGNTHNSNTAAQAVANTAQGSEVPTPSSSEWGAIGAENSSDISGP